jgi:hypothetical protein
LTLRDSFNAKETEKSKAYQFRFVFSKLKSNLADSLWLLPSQCSLEKVFADSGKHIKAFDNPFPVSEKDYLQKANGTSRIGPRLLKALLATQNPDK